MLYSLAERRSTERNKVPTPRMPSRPIDKGRLSSVATSVRLLKAFSEEQVEIGISDLAKRLGVAKSTVHRLAVTLVADGMLEQNPDTGKYRLGIALFRLGSLVRRRMTMSNEARPLLRDLREKVNETVHLAVLDGSEIMYVFNLESTQAIRMRSDVGVRKPAYCTAEGQAILAFQPADVVERVVRDGLAARTPQTITDPQTLIGGNITILSDLCEKTRNDAFQMMLLHAEQSGANAVIAAKYDATEIMQGVTEVLAYGTAVVVEKI